VIEDGHSPPAISSRKGGPCPTYLVAQAFQLEGIGEFEPNLTVHPNGKKVSR